MNSRHLEQEVKNTCFMLASHLFVVWLETISCLMLAIHYLLNDMKQLKLFDFIMAHLRGRQSHFQGGRTASLTAFKNPCNDIHELWYNRQNTFSFLCKKLLFLFIYQAVVYCTCTWCMSSIKTFSLGCLERSRVKKWYFSLSCIFSNIFSVS